MSVLRNIMSRIFGGSTLGAQAAETRPATTPGNATTGSAGSAPGPAEGGRLGGQAAPSSQPAPTPAPPPAAEVDVEAVLTTMAAGTPQRLDWRRSIVDLMKLLDLDSSLAARKELAQELGYTGTLDGSAEMNLWLHRAVMRKLAENGGRVPDDLRS
jgi:hypothetical protein